MRVLKHKYRNRVQFRTWINRVLGTALEFARRIGQRRQKWTHEMCLVQFMPGYVGGLIGLTAEYINTMTPAMPTPDLAQIHNGNNAPASRTIIS